VNWKPVYLGLGLSVGLAAAQGCIGNIGGGPGNPESQPQSCGGVVVPVERVPLRRLTAEQFRNTVRDLFGDQEFDPELEEATDETITERAVRQLRDAAELAVERRGSWTAEVFPCDVSGAADEACLDAFIDGFATRAFRRPVRDDERAWLKGIYSGTDATFQEKMEVVLQVILQSPAMIYMFEAGTPEGAIDGVMQPLTDFEVASRLSYFFWNTMPDAELYAAAASGGLNTPEGLRAQAERLMADPRAERTVQNFFSRWLQLDGGRLHHALEATEKDAALYPEYDDALRQAMRIETEAFVRRTFFEEDASFDKLMNGNYAYVNGPLAEVYGVSGPTSADTYEWVELDAGERGGLLTRAAFLTVLSSATVTSPIRRGVWVVEEALCNELGDPPPNASDVPVKGGEQENGDTLTVRQDVELRTTEGICGGCHNIVNPIGFTFENYDGIGRYRTEELTSGLPIDATGKLQGSDVDGDLANALELNQRLASSSKVKKCFAERWSSSALGSTHVEVDSCSEQHIGDKFAQSGDMRELLLAIVASNAFRFISVAEVSQ
jgi:hypothetical protein